MSSISRTAITEARARLAAPEVPTEVDLKSKLSKGFKAKTLMAAKESHIVFLTGAIEATDPSPGDVVTTIPAGWRVKTDQTIPIFDADAASWATLDFVASSGEVKWRAGDAGTYLVNGTSYVDPWGNR